jgi:hypothetical protein
MFSSGLFWNFIDYFNLIQFPAQSVPSFLNTPNIKNVKKWEEKFNVALVEE